MSAPQQFEELRAAAVTRCGEAGCRMPHLRLVFASGQAVEIVLDNEGAQVVAALTGAVRDWLKSGLPVFVGSSDKGRPLMLADLERRGR